MKQYFYLFVISFLFALNASAEIVIDRPFYRFQVSDKKVPQILTPDGKLFSSFSRLEVKPARGHVKTVQKLDGNHVRVDYQFDRKDFVGQAHTIFSFLDGPHIKIETIVVLPTDKLREFRLYVDAPKGVGSLGGRYKSGIWTRREGGIPYERKGGLFVSLTNETPALATFSWKGNIWHSCVFDKYKPEKVEGGFAFRGTIDYFVLPEKGMEFAAAARMNGEPLAFSVETGKPFNLFDSSKEKITFDLTVVNTSAEKLSVPLKVSVYDYDAQAIINETKPLTLNPWEKKVFSYAPEAPGRKLVRDIFFIDASADVNGTNHFIRANVATLPPHTYRHLDKSNLGIAAYFNINKREDVLNLFKRMGVRWLRQGGTTKELLKDYGIVCISNGNVPAGKTDDEVVANIKKWLQKAVDEGNPILEFGNEPNFTRDKVGAAKKYAHALKLLDRARTESGLRDKVKIACAGLAGADPDFMRELKKLGGLDCFDLMNVHPGRLNSTPDSPGAFWRWFYLDAIKVSKKDAPGKPLIMTEVYARTPPHARDSDSYRASAENIILSFVLAKVEGVKALCYYQMHDSMWADVGGVNSTDKEWHYGLLNRDGTIKPSLLAFCAAAEALDGAEYVKYAMDGGGNNKMWHFKTPRGPMTVLVDRTDGYYPYPGEFTGFLEPWLNHWKTTKPATFRSTAKFVVTVDAIGRKKKIPVQDGKVQLQLTGAPLIVYGLDL